MWECLEDDQSWVSNINHIQSGCSVLDAIGKTSKQEDEQVQAGQVNVLAKKKKKS